MKTVEMGATQLKSKKCTKGEICLDYFNSLGFVILTLKFVDMRNINCGHPKNFPDNFQTENCK